MDFTSVDGVTFGQGDFALGLERARDYWARNPDRPRMAGQALLHAMGFPVGGALGRDAFARIREKVTADPRFAAVRDLVEIVLDDVGQFVESMEDTCRSGAEDLECIRRDAWDGFRASRGWDALGHFVAAALAFLGEALLCLFAGVVPGFLHGYTEASLQPARIATERRPRRRKKSASRRR